MKWPPLADVLTYALRGAAALVSGTLLAASLNTETPLWPLIFVALLPMLWALRHVRPLEAVVYGLITFWWYLTVSVWWLSQFGADKAYGLCFMEGMAYAIAIGFYSWLRHRVRGDRYGLLLPACIVLVELKRNLGMWAFPWPMLGHALVYEPTLLQSAAVMGVMGLSFVVVWSNAVLARVLFEEVRPPDARWAEIRPFAMVLIWMGLYGQYSFLTAPYIQKRQEPFPATIVQRVEGTLARWSDDFILRALGEYDTLTREELQQRGVLAPPPGTVGPPAPRPKAPVGLIVWPENAIPKSRTTVGQQQIDAEVQKLVNDSNSVLVMGTFTRVHVGAPEPGSPGAAEMTPEFVGEIGAVEFEDREKIDAYNSVEIRIPGEERAIGVSSKYHLVPFGESVPMKRYLSMIDNPWGPGKNVSASKRLVPYDTPIGKVGIVVCYESFFAPIVRSLVWQGAQVMVLTSNTSWFGKHVDATYQHAYYDRARAVENRVPFVRAATTGVSSIIDPWGRDLAITEPFEGRLIPGEPYRVQGATRTALIRRRFGYSIYTYLGDWVVYLSLFGLLWTLYEVWFPGWTHALTRRFAPRLRGAESQPLGELRA